ncbi:MAG: HAMP domain-containing protein [Deltaproteobacteria bacterium]|nr:HAMP domain-containing protein [Deltaproteobacteria bacterium]
MNFSVRAKLTAWYVTLLTISLVLFSAAFFYALSKVYVDRIDVKISSVAAQMSHSIVRPPGQLSLPKDFDVILERFFGIKTGDKYIQVLDPMGVAVATSSTLGDFDLLLTDKAYKNALLGEDTYENIKPFGMYPIRLFTKPVILRDFGLVGIIQVGSSLEGMKEISRYMIYFFIFGIFGSVLISGCIGWFLARKALKPVSDITRMVRKMSVESLDKRLNVLGPDDEIGRLSATFNDMIARLEGSFSQIKQFTGDASHELKTPLTVMKGEIEIALRGESDTGEMRDVLTSTLEEIDRMSYIVKNLLTLARADVESTAATMTVVDVAEVATQRYYSFKKLASDKDVKLAISADRSILVIADPVRFGQVVFNFIDNAIKYTPSGGDVMVTVEEVGGTAIFKVKDSGIGIEAEDIAHVFDRFYRVDRARTREAGGVGLGLSICKEIVESFEGTIAVESDLGQGTTFIVSIPLAGTGDEEL